MFFSLFNQNRGGYIVHVGLNPLFRQIMIKRINRDLKALRKRGVPHALPISDRSELSTVLIMNV